MKRFYNQLSKLSVLCLGLILAISTSCSEDEGPGIPDYRVAFSFAPTAPEAGEEVTFTNASTGGEEFVWDFGDGGTSTEKDPTYTFEEAGSYTVTLMVDGYEELSATNEIVVGDPVPVISVDAEAIEAGATVMFSAEIYNPNGEEVTYAWDFGATATGEDLTEGASTVEAPSVKFTEAGMVDVTLTVTVGGVELTATEQFEVVAQLAKTLYFSVVDYEAGEGTLYSKKLLTGGADLAASDINVPTGSHPLTLRVRNERVYVFDAGDGITFTEDPAAVDGAIYSVATADYTDYITHISMADGDGDYTRDPFFGDVTADKIYWADRRNGVYSIDASAANLTYTTADYPYFVANNQLGYYSAWRADGGPTYGWGALNGTFLVRDNNGTQEFWWAKNSNHKGLWRFETTDITDIDVATPEVPALGGVLTGEAVRAFAIDDTNQKIYFSINKMNGDYDMGLYRANLDGTNIELVDGAAWHSEGGDTERTGITGIAVDAEGGYVYYGFRADAVDETASIEAGEGPLSGVKRWKIDGSEDPELYVPGVWVYGLAIDQAKN